MGPVKHIALTGLIWNSSSNRVFSFSSFWFRPVSSLLMMFMCGRPAGSRLGLPYSTADEFPGRALTGRRVRPYGSRPRAR